MRKILVAGTAAFFTALAVAASTAPANAGGITFGFGGGHGYGWGHHSGASIYIDGPYVGYRSGYRSAWRAHVDWCFDHKGPSYDPDSNTYINRKGKERVCDSPYI
jgi:hypothetical protein